MQSLSLQLVKLKLKQILLASNAKILIKMIVLNAMLRIIV